MSKKFSLSYVEELRAAAEKYTKELKELPYTEHLNEQEKTKRLKKHREDNQNNLLSAVKKIGPKIEEHLKQTKLSKSRCEFPLLNSSNENDRLRGEQQQSNALEVFKIHFLGKNSGSLFKALDDAISNGRIDFASSLIDQIKNYPTMDEGQLKIQSKLKSLEQKYFEKTKINEIDEELQILDYANKLTTILERIAPKGEEHIYLPEYGSKDYEDQMILGGLESKAHIEILPDEEIDFSPYSGMFNE